MRRRPGAHQVEISQLRPNIPLTHLPTYLYYARASASPSRNSQRRSTPACSPSSSTRARPARSEGGAWPG
eukprot:scaffold121684_cov63-Phaeocystis_antarctica.AAC.2